MSTTSTTGPFPDPQVLAVHYASRGAADSARALLHLCQLLWDTPWVAPIYALLLHRSARVCMEV